jgi:hypothetical protein
MAGVSSRAQIAETVDDSPRWESLEVEPEGMVRPADGVAILTYRACATRGDDETYRALVSSGYVRRDGSWKLMFHQHTPLENRSRQ